MIFLKLEMFENIDIEFLIEQKILINLYGQSSLYKPKIKIMQIFSQKN